jgi:esterase/lipase superfamily enzyme
VENEFATLRLIDGSAAWCLVEAMDALPSRESRIAMGNALIDRRILNVPDPDADAFRSSVPLVSGRERRLQAAKSQSLWRPADRKRLWRAIQKHAAAGVLGTAWTGAPVTERGG